MTGNVAEFRLIPLFTGRETMFACHIQPVARYKIYDIEYSLVWQGNRVNERRLTAERRVNVKQPHPLKAVDQSVNRISSSLIPTQNQSLITLLTRYIYFQVFQLAYPATYSVHSPTRPDSVNSDFGAYKSCTYLLTYLLRCR